MKIDFSTDGMEILVSFFSEENSSEDNITETINLGQAQIFMETFQKDNSLNQIRYCYRHLFLRNSERRRKEG